MDYMTESTANLLPTDAANLTPAEREEMRQRRYDSDRNTEPSELLRQLAQRQADKPADHFDPSARTRVQSDFDSRRAAWSLGRSLKGATTQRIAQMLAIATLSASRANGVNNGESLGKLTAQFAALLAPYNVGGAR